jgi:hypothetical protein
MSTSNHTVFPEIKFQYGANQREQVLTHGGISKRLSIASTIAAALIAGDDLGDRFWSLGQQPVLNVERVGKLSYFMADFLIANEATDFTK